MHITILCNIYNEAHNLPDFLDSLLVQTYKDFSVMFVDDGSVDHSVQIIASYRSLLDLSCIEIDHCGLTRARKLGFDLIDIDAYVLVLDADQVLDPSYIQLMVHTLQQHTASFVTGQRIPFDNGYWSKILTPIYDLFYARRCGIGDTISWIEGGNMLLQKKAVEAIGGLRAGVLEDTELSERARRCGYILYTNPDALIYHKYDATVYDILRREYQYGYKLADQSVYTLTNIVKFGTLVLVTFPLYYIGFFALLLKKPHKSISSVLMAPVLVFFMFFFWSMGFVAKSLTTDI